ncbi:MAG: transposase family protein [Nitrospira sp.]|nr:transposase family protein [Nitrospira sp.]
MCGRCGTGHRSYYDSKTRLIRDLSCGDVRVYLEVAVHRVSCRRCGKVKRERLKWLSDNPFYTKRVVFFVGRRCRAMSIRAVAKDVHLDWHTVKGLEEQLRRTGIPAPKVIGIDAIALKKGAYLPDRRQRSAAATSPLVRRAGSIRGEPGCFLRMGWAEEACGDPPGRDGHVEGF